MVRQVDVGPNQHPLRQHPRGRPGRAVVSAVQPGVAEHSTGGQQHLDHPIQLGEVQCGLEEVVGACRGIEVEQYGRNCQLICSGNYEPVAKLQ